MALESAFQIGVGYNLRKLGMYPARSLVQFALLFAAIVCVAGAQPCLVQGDSGPLALETFAGSIQPAFAPVQPSARLTVLLFPDAIPETERTHAERELAALYQVADKAAGLSLAIARGSQFSAAEPVKTPAAWQKLVRESLAVDASAPPVASAQFYPALTEALASLGAEWSNVLLVGLPPEVEAEVGEYALPWLRSQFCKQKLRVSYWNPDGRRPDFWNAIASATAGASNLESLAEFPQWAAFGAFREASYPAALDRGFVLERVKLRGSETPVLEAPAGARLPTFQEYADLRRAAAEAAGLMKLETLDAGQVQRMRELLQQALKVNPLDPEALRAGADYYTRYHDPKTAAMLLGALAQVRPRDPKVFAEWGHSLFAAGDLAGAEKPLVQAREGQAGGSAVSEELARIHLARQDDAGALAFLEEVLQAEAQRADLWLTRADVATRLKDWSKTADSLEKALALEKDKLDRRTSLISLYLEHGAKDRALPHVQLVAAALPGEAAIRRQYAEFLEKLDRSDDALAVWRKTLEADPSMEQAHFRVARMLLDRGALPEALAAGEAGIGAAPQSARLHLLKCEALERQGKYYAARETLRGAAQSIHDPELQARLMEMEDVSGSHAAAAYAASLAGQPSPGMLERGLEVALRDGDNKAAAEFRTRLAAAGNSSLAAWLLPKNEEAELTATVPGGLEALAFIAHMHATPPQHFFAEYCRTLADRTTGDAKQAAAYTESIREYFDRLASLKALGTAKGNRVVLEISRANKAATQKTSRILDLLGWTLRSGKEGLRVEAGEKGSQAKRQEMASALAVSQTEMQEALQANRTFTFEIEDTAAPVVLGEAKWLSSFFPKEKLNGNLAEALARDLRMAKTYAALSAMGPRVVAVLAPGADLKQLAEKHADLIYHRASALALRGAHASVPGGAAAEASWEKMVGGPVANPGQFFRALLEKDDGKLLAFFDVLGQLDREHQRFFTLSLGRLSRFYEVFRESPDMAQGASRATQSSPVVEFLRQIPLDGDLHVLFPGSPEVWLLAKGKSSNSGATKMVKKLSRIAAPDQEDVILIRILRTRYNITGARFSESDNFVAVVRIDQHREEPLDETSALLLAQHYSVAGAVYPYFASLTEVAEPQFTRFFALIDQLQSQPRFQLNLILGQLHSFIELLSLAQEAGTLRGKAAAELFGAECDRFARASGPADYTIASLDGMHDLVARAAPEDAANPDQAIERLLLGASAPVEWESGGARHALDPVAMRVAAYRKILAQQKVTPLKTLLECDRLLGELSEGKGSAADHLKELEALNGGILSVPVPKEMKIPEVDKKYLSDHEREKIPEILQRLKQQFARKKVNLEDVKKLCAEFMAAIAQPVKVTMSGMVYAYFLNPDDLLVSEDPLLLRKHRFLEPESGPIFPPSELAKGSEGAGSHLTGGFAGFFRVAGELAVSGEKPGNGEMVAVAQIGSLRATDWRRLREDDLRVLGLRLRLAREWILHAGKDQKLADALAEDSLGLLSTTRRAQLLDAIAARDWTSALGVATLGDLYALSGRYLARYTEDPWQSPVLAALRKMPDPADESRLRWLGGSPVELLGCAHAHLAELGPYEQYEWLLLPQKIAERAAEFKLFLADVAGRAGIPPAALGTLAEPLARQVMAKMHMTDMHDWHSVTRAFAGLDEEMLEAALDQKK